MLFILFELIFKKDMNQEITIRNKFSFHYTDDDLDPFELKNSQEPEIESPIDICIQTGIYMYLYCNQLFYYTDKAIRINVSF